MSKLHAVVFAVAMFWTNPDPLATFVSLDLLQLLGLAVLVKWAMPRKK